jgi:hypothetical protein
LNSPGREAALLNEPVDEETLVTDDPDELSLLPTT